MTESTQHTGPARGESQSSFAGIATLPDYLLQTAFSYTQILCNIVNDKYLIDSLDTLLSHYSAPSTSSRTKQQNRLSEAMQQWLTHSSFFILSSCCDDSLDVSPRGDAPGQAFRVLDSHTIAIPDRRGNNRIDTLRNIIHDSRVGLVFLVPGAEEALRIKGQASISIDPSLLASFELEQSVPTTVMLINVTSAYVQNARAIRRAQLWKVGDDQHLANLPGAADLSGQTIRD